MRKTWPLFKLTCGAVLMASCAAPKAVVVAEQPVEVKPLGKKPAVNDRVEPAMGSEPPLPTFQDNPRMPDMFGLPGDAEFRPTNPSKPGGDSGAVIARPPTDPPSRPKPKPTEAPE